MAAKFELFKDRGGDFRFHLKAANGEIIASGQGYKSKAAAEKGIESIKTNTPVLSRQQRRLARSASILPISGSTHAFAHPLPNHRGSVTVRR